MRFLCLTIISAAAFLWLPASNSFALQDSADKQAEKSEKPSLQERIQSVQRLLRDEKIEDAIDVMREAYQDFPGNEMVAVNFMSFLQRHGMTLAQQERNSGNKFFYESADVARSLIKKGNIPERAQELVSTSLYNEACTFAIDGKKQKALTSLDEAFENGFSNFELAKTDGDFGDLLKDEKFLGIIKKHEAGRIQKMVDGFKSYDFDFSLNDVDEKPLKKSDFAGKVLIVDIWGTWCPPCRREIPSFIKLKKKYADKLDIVGLAYERTDDDDEAIENVKEFMEDTEMNYRCAIGTTEIKKQVPDLQGYPTTLFIDGSGKVRMELVGFQSYKQLEDVLLYIMNEK